VDDAETGQATAGFRAPNAARKNVIPLVTKGNLDDLRFRDMVIEISHDYHTPILT
jgi:hypothetical protein